MPRPSTDVQRSSGPTPPVEVMGQRLEPLRRLARQLENRFRIPGTPIRFGLDALVGLIPGAGDALTALTGSYALFIGAKLGAPPAVLVRMLANLAIDALVGAIPVVGDVFDVGWRATTKNLNLLERYVSDPHRTQRRSRLALIAAVTVLLGVVGISIAVALWFFTLLLRVTIPLT